MKPPPAFQLYADDFLAGTFDMSNEEVGAYIRLLCHQWNRGSIPVATERQQRLAGGSISELVLEKFEICDDGELRNARLESVRRERLEYSEKQAEKGRKSAEARKNGQPRFNHGSNSGSTAVPTTVQPDDQPHVNSPSPSPSPVQLRESADRPSLQEVIGYASTIGLATWKAEDWWQEMEGCGWIDHNRREVRNWQRILDRVRTKWEADGRPKSPPTNYANNRNSNTGGVDRNKGTFNEGKHEKYGKLKPRHV